MKKDDDINWFKVSSFAGGIIFFVAWLFCFKMISPGYVGVVVDMLGDNKGVESKELHVGMHWIAPWKSVYQFPIFEQNDTWEGDRNGFNFQNYIRDAINKSASHTRIEDLYSGKECFFEDIEKHVRDDLAPIGIELSRIYLIGRFH